MDLSEQLKILEKNYNQLGKQLEEVKTQLTHSVNLEKNHYFYISTCADICETLDTGKLEDVFRGLIGNYFSTRNEAINAIRKLQIYTRLKAVANRLNANRKLNWYDEEQPKYYIYGDNQDCQLHIAEHYLFQNLCTIYCLDRDFLTVAKQEIGEQNLKELFVNE